MTILQIHDEKIPLSPDDGGSVRIAGTRVSLECVAEMFEDGASPEGIVEQYDALRLDDVYAVITYLLRNRDEVASYLCSRGTDSERTSRGIDDQFPMSLRAKLLKAKRERDAIEGMGKRDPVHSVSHLVKRLVPRPSVD